MGLPVHHRPMRRVEREITDPAELEKILNEVTLLFLAFNDHPAPYVVPVCFAHVEGTLYVHSARAGTKIELMKRNANVGFSGSTEPQVTAGDSPCEYSARGQSVAGTGSARIVEDEAELTRGMDLIMRHYAGAVAAEDLVYRPGSFSRTAILAITIASLRGKRIGQTEAL